MLSKIIKFFLGVVLMLVVSALLAFNALLLWVATGPRSLSAVTPYIEAALSATDNSYNVKISETKLIWDGWKHPVDIRLQDLSVINKDGQLITNLPEISLGVDIFYLPFGRIVPTSIIISNPIINLVQNADRSFNFGFKPTPQTPDAETPREIETVPFSTILAPFLIQDETNNLSHLKRIIIKNAGVNLSSPSLGLSMDANGVIISITKNRSGNIKINGSGNINYKNQTSSLSADFSLPSPQAGQASIFDGAVEFSTITPNEFSDIFSQNKEIKGFAVPIRGKIGLAINLDGVLQRLDFDINSDKGSMSSDYFTAPLSIDSLQAQGRFLNHFKDLEITALSAEINGVQIAASVNSTSINSSSAENPTEESPAIEADIVAKNIAAEQLNALWPPSLAPITREWVIENIISGKVPEAHLMLDIRKGDLAKPILPRASIDANIKMDDLKIRYLPEHPPVEHVMGDVHIDGIGLVANIKSADYLQSTKLSDGHVFIDDLNAENPYIKVDLNANAPASDIVHFLGLPRLKHAQHLGLKEKEITGKVTGSANVGFYFFAPTGKKAEDAIVYDVKSEVTDLTQNGFLQKFDGKNINGKINVNNQGLDFSGKGEVSGANVSDLQVKYLFTPSSPEKIDTFIEIAATADDTAIKRMGYPDFPFIKGTVGVKAKVTQGENYERTIAALDLSNTEINYEDIGWQKPLKIPANLDLTTEKKGSTLTIPSFHLIGKDIEAKGAATISPDFSSVEGLILSQFNYNGNDISALNYAKKSGMTILDITAKSVNLTPYTEKSEKEEANGTGGISFKNFPAMQLKADIGTLILNKNREIKNLNGDLICDVICRSANLSGTTGDKPFTIRISSNDKTGREIAVNAGDAGSFLHNIGALDGMNGGVLKLNGRYKEGKDTASNSTLIAKLTISEHTIKDAPLLGKILSLASFTGFIDALQGNGIRFTDLSIPFTLHNDIATLEKGKTYGSALGITVDGTITFPNKNLDLQGTIVPSYMLNSILGNVPFIGEQLMGGEGQGLLAANYSIKGTEQNANVSVNPLSILTPGFLRGLFDVLDEKPKDAGNPN